MAENLAKDSETLKLHLQSFLSGKDESGKTLSIVDKTQCAIVLLHSLPCARHAVLEQLCEVFHEAVQKYVVELERQALSGVTGLPDALEPELISVLQNVSEVVQKFVDNNPSAWAPLICKWSLNLLGQVVTKNNGRRGVSLTMSLSEGLHKWMSFPAVQRLMDIAVHCCEKLNRIESWQNIYRAAKQRVSSNQGDVCVQCLLQIAVDCSPHLDWAVAHIGSHFHEAFIPKLLSTARKEYTSANSVHGGGVGGDTSVLTPTVVQVLTYLSIQHSQDVKSNLLALFNESVSCNSEEQLSTVPFLLHIAILSPNLVKGTITEFLEALTPVVLSQLLEQSKRRRENKRSLVSSVVDVIKSTGAGAYEIFQFLLKNCEKSQDTGTLEFHPPQSELQSVFIFIMELLLIRLQETALQRHGLFYKRNSLPSLLSKSSESEFLIEMAWHLKELCTALLTCSGTKLSWVFRVLVLIAVHSGRGTAVEVLHLVFSYSKTRKSLQLFVQLQCELEPYFPQLLDEVVRTCVSSLKSSGSASGSIQVSSLLQNLYQLISMEKDNQLTPRSKISPSLQQHRRVFACLLMNPNFQVSVKALDLVLSLNNAASECKVSTTMKTCCNSVAFFYKLLHRLAELEDKVNETLQSIKLCRELFLLLSKDDRCRLLILRLLVEGTLKEEHRPLFGGTIAVEPADMKLNLTELKVSLLERNRNPHISSHLPLTPSSVFFSGIIGDIERSNKISAASAGKQLQIWLQTSQVITDVIFHLCACEQEEGESFSLHPKYVDSLALLLMELVCPDVIPITFDWPDDESLKFTVERDLQIKKTFDDNPILWTLLRIVAKGVSSLSKCSPLVSSLLATIMSSWEVYRGSSVDKSTRHFKSTCLITEIMTSASWLPPPLCRVGAVFGILKPKEIYALLSTMWKVLKEYPPPSSAMTPEATRQRWQQGSAFKSQKEVVKAIFVNNIEKLGHLYSRVFDES